MRIMLTCLILLTPVIASAFVPTETVVSKPYEIVPIESASPEEVSFLGTLENYPIMYEVTSEEAFTFKALLRQPTNQVPEPFSLLLIRRNDRGGGVTEIARETIAPSEWSRTRDSLLGIGFLELPLSAELEPGIYRLEVSSPANKGQYALTIGQESKDVGYFEQLGYIRQTQSYFGYGFLTMLRSSLVYYPIGILLLLGAFYQTWRFASKRRSDA